MLSTIPLIVILLSSPPQVKFSPMHNTLVFDEPIQVIFEGSNIDTMYVVEKKGLVRTATLEKTTTKKPIFLDITDRVKITNDEEGLLSFAFAPNYDESGQVYVWYSAQCPKRGVLSRFTKSTEGEIIDNKTEQVLLEVREPWGNHNGGTILFGEDGFLYLGIGDGGAANDPYGNGQNTNTLLGSIIRLDVSSKDSYKIPPTNPLVGKEGVRTELWAWGLRNPWRMSFDKETGKLWVGDVGQNSLEEIDVVTGGENFGWNMMEGTRHFGSKATTAENLIAPVYEYGRRSGGSITGGYVYRGKKIPNLNGSYIFADYLSKRAWALLQENKEATETICNRIAKSTPISIASFGETPDGEILACGFLNPYASKGKIYLLVESKPASLTMP